MEGMIYAIFFAMYFIMLLLVLYAPIWLSVIAGLGISFIGSLILGKKIRQYLQQKGNIFETVKKLGKILVFAFVPPNKVYLFPAERDISSNKLRIKILKGRKYEAYEFALTPKQEFNLIIPETEIPLKKEVSIWDFLENIDKFVFELQDPVTQVFKIEPYSVDTVFFVYPTEIITIDQLKTWNIKKIGEEMKEVQTIDPTTGREIKQEVIIPIYSPKPYAISTDNIKELSAKHRFSQVATVLEQTKEILGSAERVVAGAIGGIGGGIFGAFAGFWEALRRNPWMLFFIVMMLIGLFSVVFLTKIFAGMNAKMTSAAAKYLANRSVFP